MTSRHSMHGFFMRIGHVLLVTLALMLLAACGGSGSGSSEPGIEAGFSATNSKSARNNSMASTEEGQTFYTAQGKRIDLENGFVSLAPVGLVACSSTVATVGRWLGNFLVPQAIAHGSTIEAPAGVMDVAEADGTVLDLGEIPASPGNYCAIELELVRLPVDAPGGDQDGLVYVAPCYYPDSGTIPHVPGAVVQPDEVNHACYQIPVPGSATILRLQLPSPLALDGARRQAAITVMVEYDTWFDGVDVPSLASGDVTERLKLINNIAASMRVSNVVAQ